jgi:predicted metal-dependent phosphoesterase TrpH
MAQGKLAYVEVEFVSAKEAIQHIKDAGGLSVFAHPGNNIGMNEALLEEILALGIDGIEVYSSYHNEEKTQFYREKALAHHLLMTLGSDFHGKSKPAIKLGQFKCPDELKLTEAFLSRPEILPYL